MQGGKRNSTGAIGGKNETLCGLAFAAGWLALALSVFNCQFSTAFAQNTAFTYQGRVVDNGTNFTGTGRFKFALVTSSNTSYVTFWSNDGTSVAGSEPSAAVSVAVSNGLFTAVLGDTTRPNMAPIAASLFTQPNLQLRIWFNDGVNGSTALSPAQNLTPVPYAAMANSAGNLLGTLPASQLSGTLALAQLPGAVVTNNETNLNLGGVFSGNYSGNAAGLTNVSAASVTGLGSAAYSNATDFSPDLSQFLTTEADGNSYFYRPPFGYNTWPEYSSGITETIITNAVQTIKTNGLLAFCQRVGIPFVFSIDDFFIQGNDPVTHLPTCNPATFPDGVAFVLNYIYTNGMVPGVYLTTFQGTNPNYTAPYQSGVPNGFEDVQARFYASNHVGYIKYDGLWRPASFTDADITNLYSSVKFISLCRAYSTNSVFINTPVKYTMPITMRFANAWRTFGMGYDLLGHFIDSDAAYGVDNIAQIAQLFWVDAATNANFSSRTGPWHTPDFDNVGASVDQGNLTQMILRCIFGAPIIVGDVRTNDWFGISDDYRIYTNNPELLAIDWDSGYQAPFWAGTNNGVYFYVRPLGSGVSTYKALAAINRNYTEPSDFTYNWYATNFTFQLTNAGYAANQMVLVKNVGGQVDSTHGISSYIGTDAHGYILVSNSFSVPQLDGIDSAMFTLQPATALPLPYQSNLVSLNDWLPFWQTNLSLNGLQQFQLYNIFGTASVKGGIGQDNLKFSRSLQFLSTNHFVQWGIYGATNFSAALGYDNFDANIYRLTNYSRWIILIDGVTNYDSQNWGPIGVTNKTTNISLALSGTAQVMTIRYLTAGANFSVGDLGNPTLTFLPSPATGFTGLLATNSGAALTVGGIVNNGTFTSAGNALFSSNANFVGVANTASNQVFGANNLLTGSLGDARYAPLPLCVLTNPIGTVISNTTIETSVWSTFTGSSNTASGFFVAGRKLRLKGEGYYWAAVANTATVRLRVKIGSVTADTTVTPAIPASASGAAFTFDIPITCYGVGANVATNALGGGFYYSATLNGTTVMVFNDLGNAAANFTFAANQPNGVDLTAQWSVAMAGDSLVVKHCSLIQEN